MNKCLEIKVIEFIKNGLKWKKNFDLFKEILYYVSVRLMISRDFFVNCKRYVLIKIIIILIFEIFFYIGLDRIVEKSGEVVLSIFRVGEIFEWF